MSTAPTVDAGGTPLLAELSDCVSGVADYRVNDHWPQTQTSKRPSSMLDKTKSATRTGYRTFESMKTSGIAETASLLNSQAHRQATHRLPCRCSYAYVIARWRIVRRLQHESCGALNQAYEQRPIVRWLEGNRRTVERHQASVPLQPETHHLPLSHRPDDDPQQYHEPNVQSQAFRSGGPT